MTKLDKALVVMCIFNLVLAGVPPYRWVNLLDLLAGLIIIPVCISLRK